MAKLVYGWENRKYEREREKKWEKNWTWWKYFLGQGILRGGSCHDSIEPQTFTHLQRTTE